MDSLADATCSNAETERILDDLTQRIVGEETFVVTPTVRIVDHPMENALAFLGGRVIVFRGLLEAVQSPDELTGVIAHEFGHVAARDSLVKIIEAAGLGFVFGYVLGDFTGGTAVVLAAQAIVSSAYSREAEAAADAFAARRMMALGGDPLASIQLIERIEGVGDAGDASPFDSHPVTEERGAAVRALAAGYTARGPLLSLADQKVLQATCPQSSGETAAPSARIAR
nr:M48 family metallopeptidase [Chthonobacter albigriseus]